jgi:hypothetical protein
VLPPPDNGLCDSFQGSCTLDFIERPHHDRPIHYGYIYLIASVQT